MRVETTKSISVAPLYAADHHQHQHHHQQQQQKQKQVRPSLVVAPYLHKPRLMQILLLLAGVMMIIGSQSSYSRLRLLAEALPNGAPESACKTLKPGHGGEPSSEPSPFVLHQDKLQVEAGDQIKVTLSSPSAKTFKGLIVQALNDKGETVGKFLAGSGLKLLDSCSAVTHSDREPKKTATLVWEAPSDLKGKETITFKGTVVHKFDEFYMNIKSTLATARRR